MLPRLNHVIKQEDINVSDSGMELLLKMAEGDMRRSLNILQASHMAYDKVDDEIVYKVRIENRLCEGKGFKILTIGNRSTPRKGYRTNVEMVDGTRIERLRKTDFQYDGRKWNCS